MIVCFLLSAWVIPSVSVCNATSTISNFAPSMLETQDPALVFCRFEFTNKPLKGPVCPYLPFWVQLHHQRAPKRIAFFLNQDAIDLTQGFHNSVSANTDKGNDCLLSAVYISSDLFCMSKSWSMMPLKNNLIPNMATLTPATYWECNISSGCFWIIQSSFGLWQQMWTGVQRLSPVSSFHH